MKGQTLAGRVATGGLRPWVGVCAEVANRGVKDALIVCCDGLTGFPEAVAATWPETTVRTCVMHLIRAAMRFVGYGDARLDRGRAGNAIACIFAAVGQNVTRLLGPDAVGQSGTIYAGLPWAGCSLLAGTKEDLHRISTRAHASDQEYVVDMPESAQGTRVYLDYLAQKTRDTEPVLLAVSVVGPRNRIDKLTKGLQLL